MKCAIACTLVLVAGHAFALEPAWNTAGNYERVRDDVGTRIWLTAAGSAFGVANAQTVALGGSPLFCVPQTLILNEKNYVSIFEKTLPRARKVFGDKYPTIPWEIILLDGLRVTFPCQK